MNTESFRKQHAQLNRLLNIIDGATAARNDLAIVSGFTRLRSSLFVQWWRKERIIYPEFLNHPDTRMRRTAKHCQDKTANVQQLFASFYDRWCEPRALACNRSAFTTEWAALRKELAATINAEERELYNQVEDLKLGAGALTRNLTA